MGFANVSDWRRVYRDEARTAYLDMKRRYPEDRITAFALLTDDDYLSFVPRADTEKLADARLKENMPEGKLEEQFHRWQFLWNTSEWTDIYDEDFPVSSTGDLSPEESFDVMMAFREQWFARPGNTDNKFRQEMLRLMCDVLHDLDEEGLFGAGQERDQVTLFLEISDSDLDDVLKLWSAAKLNPKKSRNRMVHCLPWFGRVYFAALGWIGFLFRGPLVAIRSPA